MSKGPQISPPSRSGLIIQASQDEGSVIPPIVTNPGSKKWTFEGFGKPLAKL
jgi:hypothetical protein